MFYGGKIAGDTKPFGLSWPGNMDGYSVQWNAQTLANDYDIVSDNGRVGNAVDTGSQTFYNALMQQVDQGSELTATPDLNDAAATALKDTKNAKIIPTVVTRKLTPMVDFDFGTKFRVDIDDWYAQVGMTVRTVGWQLTVSGGDKTTTVIYTKDTDAVS
jgi:hypothetical protein